jgi:hypothetical protein
MTTTTKPEKNKKHYIDRDVYHDELAKCKKADELSRISLDLFKLHSEECSRDFYFQYEADRDDAVASAMHDLFKYWKNFKESNVVQVKLNRNFVDGESISVNIHGKGVVTYIAKSEIPEEYARSKDDDFCFEDFLYEPPTAQEDINRMERIKRGEFEIGSTINISLANLSSLIKSRDNKILAIYVDKIKNKITLMDKHNGDDLSAKSSVECSDSVVEMAKVKIVKGKDIRYVYIPLKDVDTSTEHEVLHVPLVDVDKKGTHMFKFKEPPNAFSYFTSIIRNGILKSINKINPKQLRGGKKISIDSINNDNNGMYNL